MTSDVEEMWNEFQAQPFPDGCAGFVIDGIELASLDTFAAGCIDTFVGCKGRLDSDRVSILRQCSEELNIVVKKLDGEAQGYFERLRFLAEKVLASVK